MGEILSVRVTNYEKERLAELAKENGQNIARFLVNSTIKNNSKPISNTKTSNSTRNTKKILNVHGISFATE